MGTAKGLNTYMSHSTKVGKFLSLPKICLYEPRHDKTNNVVVRPAKTQISLGIRQSDQSLRCPHEESFGP